MATSTSIFVFLKGHNDFLFTIARAAEKNYPDNTPSRNWHLDWQNLLGCCHGGSQRNVVDASQRFTSPESSCDVPKGEKNLDDVILNPLHIPAFPKFFTSIRSYLGHAAEE
ncbi:hypothetical protein [Marinomonas sp.]|uniref:hypothetical protein n=1 Tax=Marinomonas sp. TaxID=1904862 RepID=UPI003F95F094